MEEQEVVVEAFTELASRYEKVVDSELNRFWGWSYTRFVNRLIELTIISDGDLILDVATGTAVIPRRLVEAVKKNFHVIGLDITAAMLRRGKEQIEKAAADRDISLSCGDALVMPFSPGSFDLVMCGLATHHMNVPAMLSEMSRVLKPGGRLAMADAAGSPLWNNPLLRTAIRVAAYVYFLVVENASRAGAEAAAVSNIRSDTDWQADLRQAGFVDIRIVKLPSKRSWIPDPLVIEATKP
ncbi:MAG: methyltransferase domain-containing protein [Anaerolineales bacterium]|jgi:ubiquinone/menaquinone biosynthesis C-methylase UbiE